MRLVLCLIVIISSIFIEAQYVSKWDKDGFSSVPLIHFGEKSYYLGVHYQTTFFEADQLCRHIDMELVRLESTEEKDNLYKRIKESTKETDFWTAGSKILDKNHWSWVTSGEVIDFNGLPNKPHTELCLELQVADNDLKFDDKECHSRFSFICQNDKGQSNVSANKNNTKSDVQFVQRGDKTYFFGSHNKITFFEADQMCRHVRMGLVRVQSSQEKDNLYKYIKDSTKEVDFWTSGSKLLDKDNWRWITSGEVIEYTNWGSGSPDNSDSELCLEVQATKDDLKYDNKECRSRFPFICEGGDTSKALLPPSVHYKDKSYFFGTNYEATFIEADQMCRHNRMKLVQVKSAEENDILYNYIKKSTKKTNFWTSGTKLVDKKTWIWLTSGETIKYFNWGSGLPNNPDTELCLQLRVIGGNLKFDDNRCESKAAFICEA